ncbi:hypothetical protein Mapa_014454 [Marchantia paleacea]|nr:hypothetical protein Mapa_014454 [Marchantia paleacea]
MRSRFMLRLKTLAKNMRMGYDPRVMQGLIDKVKTHIDMHYLAINSSVHVNLRQRYNSCVVVGNSGELLNKTGGNFIDEHDLVVRINNAKGRETVEKKRPLSDFIGSKTTLMFMNSHILHQCTKSRKCYCHPYGKHVPIVLYLCDVEHILDVAICGGEHNSPLFVTDRRFDLLVTKIARWYSIRNYFQQVGGANASKWRQWELLHDWEGKHKHEHHYSSGMQAVVLALGLCEHVDLVGFGKRLQFKHHFHSGQLQEHYAHDYEAEYEFYADLENHRVDNNPFLCEAGTYIPPLRVLH